MPSVTRFYMQAAEVQGVPSSSYLLQPSEHFSTQNTTVRGAMVIAGGRGKIMFFGIVLNGAACGKFRSEPRHALADTAQPPGRHTVFRSVIEVGDHLLLQQLIHGFGLDVV